MGGSGLGGSVRLCKERQIERESEIMYGSVRVCKSEKECVRVRKSVCVSMVESV